MQQEGLLKNAPFLFDDDVLRLLSNAGISTVDELMVAEASDISARSNGLLSVEAVVDARSKAAAFFGGMYTTVERSLHSPFSLQRRFDQRSLSHVDRADGSSASFDRASGF